MGKKKRERTLSDTEAKAVTVIAWSTPPMRVVTTMMPLAN